MSKYELPRYPITNKLFTHIENYPIFYINKHGDVLCPECARRVEGEGAQLVDRNELPFVATINFGDDDFSCAYCHKEFNSLYKEEDENDLYELGEYFYSRR